MLPRRCIDMAQHWLPVWRKLPALTVAVADKSCPETAVAAAGIHAVGNRADSLSKSCPAGRNRRVAGLAGFGRGRDPSWRAGPFCRIQASCVGRGEEKGTNTEAMQRVLEGKS